jgi:hypothetical protein
VRRITIVLGLAVLFLVMSLAWAAGSAEVANMNLQEDIRDLAAQGGTRIGLLSPSSDEDIRNIVVRKAQEHGIALKPQQVIVRRTDSGETSTLHIAAHYTVPVNLWLFSLNLHFTPSSDKNAI